jgi:crossover junction endodeoxyribonuclease RuvC
MHTVVGIDLSLTSTGIAIITNGVATTQRVNSKGKKDATLEQRMTRLHNLALTIASDIVWKAHPTLVVIESPAYSRTMGSMHDRSGLWWMTLDLIDSLELTVVEVTSGGRCKYATGKGNAAKDDVLSAVVRRYPDVDVNGNDEADALILAAMGARHLGVPIEESLPKANLLGMAGVHWPYPQLGQAAS